MIHRVGKEAPDKTVRVAIGRHPDIGSGIALHSGADPASVLVSRVFHYCVNLFTREVIACVTGSTGSPNESSVNCVSVTTYRRG